jgi:hypothetical protein
MKSAKQVGLSALVVGLMVLSTACVVEPRENYYDRDHHRYYTQHAWHDCGDHDDHCR